MKCDCKQCAHLEKMKRLVLGACRPAGKGIDDHIVFMWNETVKNYKCLKGEQL
jgi:hypothetical protein